MADIQLAIIPTAEVSTGKFDRLWVSNLVINKGSVVALLSPFDGQFLLSGQNKKLIAFAGKDVELKDLITNIFEAVKVKYNKNASPVAIRVNASLPSKPISVQCIFSTDGRGEVFNIPDLMAIAVTDPAIAGLFASMIAWIATNVDKYSVE